jgi:hypothetical protein
MEDGSPKDQNTIVDVAGDPIDEIERFSKLEYD